MSNIQKNDIEKVSVDLKEGYFSVVPTIGNLTNNISVSYINEDISIVGHLDAKHYPIIRRFIDRKDYSLAIVSVVQIAAQQRNQELAHSLEKFKKSKNTQ